MAFIKYTICILIPGLFYQISLPFFPYFISFTHFSLPLILEWKLRWMRANIAVCDTNHVRPSSLAMGVISCQFGSPIWPSTPQVKLILWLVFCVFLLLLLIALRLGPMSSSTTCPCSRNYYLSKRNACLRTSDNVQVFFSFFLLVLGNGTWSAFEWHIVIWLTRMFVPTKCLKIFLLGHIFMFNFFFRGGSYF